MSVFSRPPRPEVPAPVFVWKEQIFFASGTWVCPAPDTEVEVLAIGGGAGGGSYARTSGGTTSFGAHLSAAGGVEGGDGYSLGWGNTIGQAPQSPGCMGIGHGGMYTGATGTGKGAGSSGFPAFGRFVVSANVTVTVGLGGLGDVGGTPGSHGMCQVRWLEAV